MSMQETLNTKQTAFLFTSCNSISFQWHLEMLFENLIFLLCLLFSRYLLILSLIPRWANQPRFTMSHLLSDF